MILIGDGTKEFLELKENSSVYEFIGKVSQDILVEDYVGVYPTLTEYKIEDQSLKFIVMYGIKKDKGSIQSLKTALEKHGSKLTDSGVMVIFLHCTILEIKDLLSDSSMINRAKFFEIMKEEI